MIKVITYGSYDLLHYGHLRLLERAKALGDYLIVGVTSDDYDRKRGKINGQQTFMERVAAVRSTGLADEIILEEYEGQKIDDVRKYDIDVFVMGSDWEGAFDYLKEYCSVVYLPRTEGVSSSIIREEKKPLRLGLVGDGRFLNKVWNEAQSVNGIHTTGLCSNRSDVLDKSALDGLDIVTDSMEKLIDQVDALYVRSAPEKHYEHISMALKAGKHVLCESPLTLSVSESRELMDMAKENNLILMETVKTAYATAYERLLLLIKTDKIGKIISVDSTCTSIREEAGDWRCIHEWGPTALLPILQILGTDYKDCRIVSKLREDGGDSFTRMDFLYEEACASITVSDGFKSEGDLVISGSQGYIYVPAPWWKTDYYEVRYEDQSQNKRYFYQLEGEGIRYELVAFKRAVDRGTKIHNIEKDVTLKIAEIMEQYEKKENMRVL